MAKDLEPRLPTKQLAILAVVRFSEPLALTSVFPYLPEMIKGFGIGKNDIAKWAGIVGAIFSISQSLTAVPWGWASDRIGRKPTILLGLTCTMICFIFWGISTSLPMAIAVRALLGAGNGNVGIIRTMVAEMVPEKVLQPKAFSIMPLVWSIGSVFGPAFGGFFAKPAEQYPSLFGNIEFLKKFPFALPNLVACVFFTLSVITAALFLEETLASKKHSRDWGLVLGEKLTRSFQRHPRPHLRRHSLVDAEASAPLLTQDERDPADLIVDITPEPKTGDIFTYDTIMALVCYTFLALHSVAYDQVLPVFLNYPTQVPDKHNTKLPFKFSGGFGLESGRIGTIFTAYGVACGVIQFFIFPPLCTRFGSLRCYRLAMLLYPVVYLVTPYTGLIQTERTRYAALGLILLVKGFVGIIGFPCITIMLTNAAPSLKILGTLNGFATTFSGVGRAAGPALTGAAFTWGVQRGYMITGWWTLAAIAVLGAVPPFFMREGEGPYRPVDARDIEELYEEAMLDIDADGDDGSDDDDDDGLARDAQRKLAASKNARSVPEETVIPEPDDLAPVSPPLSPQSIVKRSSTIVGGPGPAGAHVRLRSMSAGGKDLEHNRDDPDWRAKQGDDEIEG
ncbi:uncharacterized protein E0L32_003314 [Thyridium curvatum]|uniref:Major facilitator superfamily (MFS) profile domain-containing protein n=1 Tax=Thyridium curvatum TaxID=1093900 RepID=A0A507BD53_9PEZI|nr:uncharacterized protein E0L32_003314 [Thyridium curvatum]TPX17196.1 hypothetical protein E0L32_003314 [Thyridium curvatum]